MLHEHAAHALPLLVGLAVLVPVARQAGLPRPAPRLLLAAALVAAASTHVVATAQHTGVSRAFFVAVTVGQLLLALAALHSRSSWLLPAVVGSSAGLVALWWVSRFVAVAGEPPHAVGAADLVAVLAELASLALVSRPLALPQRLRGEHLAWSLIVFAVTTAAVS